ncbi:hypothetical protein PV327_007914 [Microctonus hyperodae]|uniref:Uncharacterized protein n=1 Tax=Microctonus hyperodae TaxID=165561 RepID=A0AA39G0L2_MICHY|nr:hypothetical protein PV327_007914 [Microctonus hyperodae]
MSVKDILANVAKTFMVRILSYTESMPTTPQYFTTSVHTALTIANIKFKPFNICVLSILVTVINGKIIPMSFVYHASEVSNGIEIDSNVQRSKGINEDNEKVQSGPTRERLEELYKTISTMSIPCVNSLRNIEPIIRHKFKAKKQTITEEEISTLSIMIDNLKLIGVMKDCEGRRFGQPPLPWKK